MAFEMACSFAGNRLISDQFKDNKKHQDFEKIKLLMTTQIGMLIYNGVRTFLTGMSLGADIWGAQIVVDLKQKYPDINLVAVLPCETQANKWPIKLHEQYYNILAECSETVYISRHYTPGCIFERNHWLIDHSTFLLVVYNGTSRGSTASTVRYAYNVHRNVIIINPDTFEIKPYPIIISE